MWAMMEKLRNNAGAVTAPIMDERVQPGGFSGPRATLLVWLGCPGTPLPTRNSATVANIKQQKKRNRQNEIARVRNKSVRSEVKTAVRRLDEAIAEADTDVVAERGREAQKKVGVAGRKGVLHKNTVARRQSRIAKKANAASEA